MELKKFSKENKFIRKFNKISSKRLLKKYKVSEGNFYTGRANHEKEKQVKRDLIKEVLELFLEDIENEQ